MLCSEMLSLRSFEEWLAGERRRRAQEMAESKELDEAAGAQVGRPRQRWCIGSGECKLPRYEDNTCATNSMLIWAHTSFSCPPRHATIDSTSRCSPVMQ